MEEATFELNLKLTLPAKTLKKLKSYAMLSGMSVNELEDKLVSEVEPELAVHFDSVLTKGIVSKLGELDGVDLSVMSREEESESRDDSDHELSADDDVGAKSLEEQVEEDKAPIRESAEPSFNITVPDVGEDAEQFLDATLASGKKIRASSSGGMTEAGKSFSAKKPRVTISDHTGSESSSF